MKARTAARELALLTLFQLEKKGQILTSTPKLEEIILNGVRALVEQAKSQIQTAAEQLAQTSQLMVDLELDHPDNLETSIETPVQPVQLPTTREVLDHIESCLQGAEYLFEALQIPEFAALAQTKEVNRYSLKLVEHVQAHHTEIDVLLNEVSEDWRVDRLVKMDRCLLRLAVAEMKYVGQVDLSVTINEIVELAKKFSSEESFRFINGLLGTLSEQFENIRPQQIENTEENTLEAHVPVAE